MNKTLGEHSYRYKLATKKMNLETNTISHSL